MHKEMTPKGDDTDEKVKGEGPKIANERESSNVNYLNYFPYNYVQICNSMLQTIA